MRVLATPRTALSQVHQLLEMGGTVVRPEVQEVTGANELDFWVFVELYLDAAGGDLRTAISLAHSEHTAAGTTFVLPGGTYQWNGSPFAPRNNTTWICDGCTIERDMAGVASGQIFFFLRTETNAQHADRIRFQGGVFRLLNVLTSYFSAAVQFEAASNCTFDGCTAQCTLDAAATEGRIRWGFNLLGGDISLGSGKNNRFRDCTLSFAQIQGCGAGRSADGVVVENTIVDDANDLAVSVVSSGATQTLQNVSIRNTVCHNVAGSNVVFAGTDGAGTGIGVGVLRNIEIDGVWLDGQRSTPDLAFQFNIAVQVCGGLVTENVVVGNVGTRLVPNATLQARSVQISSQEDEVSWTGLSLHDLQLGVVTSNDPLEALFISGRNISGCEITNVTVHGVRGVRIVDVDQLVATNLVTRDGTCLVIASSRNLQGLEFNNCNFRRVTGFQSTLNFSSTTGRSMSGVMLCNIQSNGNGTALNTTLAGGSMQMWLCNFDATNNSNPTAETLAGIIRYKNVRGFTVLTTVSVVVPAVAAGAVGYVDVSMVGTRLADLAVGEPVVANPSADLVAAGAGGAYANARVSAVGSVRMAFLGPLAGGASNFTFDRAN